MLTNKKLRRISTTREVIEACVHEVCNWRPGDVVVRQGEDVDALYLVVSGRLEVWHERADSHVLVDVIGAGALVAEIGMVAPGPAIATVRAPTAARGLRVRCAALASLWRIDPVIARELHGRAMRALIERLRGANLEPSQVAARPDGKGGAAWTREAA